MPSGTPVQRRKLGLSMAKRKHKVKRLDHGGYSLVELMVVIVIMVILASVSIGVYNGYVSRAKSAVFYEKGHRIAEAFKISEAEYDLSGEFDKREMAEEVGNIMKKPCDPDSPLYQYVGEETDDCTDFTLSFKNTGDGKMEINGFTYTADAYEIRWTEDGSVKVTMK